MRSFFTGARRADGFDLSRLVRRIVALVFALIQLVLVARILFDVGVIPNDWSIGDSIVTWSDLVAAPVEGVGNGLGFSGFDTMAGEGFNPVMVAALVGWSVVEGLIMQVVKKFDQV